MMFVAYFLFSLFLLGALAFWGYRQWQDNTAREEREERARADQRGLFSQSEKRSGAEATSSGRSANFGRR